MHRIFSRKKNNNKGLLNEMLSNYYSKGGDIILEWDSKIIIFWMLPGAQCVPCNSACFQRG